MKKEEGKLCQQSGVGWRAVFPLIDPVASSDRPSARGQGGPPNTGAANEGKGSVSPYCEGVEM